MGFVHVETGLHFTVAFAQFCRPIRIAFYIKPVAFFKRNQQKYFSASFKNQRIIAKRHGFFRAGFVQAIFAE